jgi:ceramide glucosyltransferase
MPHLLAQSVEVLTTVLTVACMGYYLAAMVAARIFLADRRAQPVHFAPGVSILKSLKGLDPGMIEAFRSHCRQNYSGEYELLFGVSSLSDPAVSAVEQLIRSFLINPFSSSSAPNAWEPTVRSARWSSSRPTRASTIC